MPNIGHKWTDMEEKAALEATDYEDFRRFFPDITPDAFRIRRQNLRRQLREEGKLQEMVRVDDLIKVPAAPITGSREGYVGPLVAFFDIETTYSSQPRFLYGNITDSWAQAEKFSLYDERNAGADWLDDSILTSRYARALEEYDILVSWNGKLFDVPVLNGRLNYWRARYDREGYPDGFSRRDFMPVDPQMHIDLMYYASGQFNRIGRRSLESVSTFFDSPHRKTPLSVRIWDRADHGSREDYALIEEHCDADDLVLRDVYAVLKPHIRNIHR